MAITDIKLRWVLSIVGENSGKKLLVQDRAIRSSLKETDTSYTRMARTAASTGDKQASAASRTATALKREGGAVAGVSAEMGRYAAAQREALTIGSRIVPQVDKVTGAYSRQAKAAKAAHTEQSRLSKIGSGGSSAARKVGTVVGGGVLAAGYAAFSGIHEGGELAKEVAGLKGLTGLTGREAQALAVTTKALDINTRQVGQSFGTLGKQVIGLSKGTASSVDIFKRLQISPTEADKLKNNLPALFDLVYKRAQKLPQAERASVLKQVLGRGGTTAGQIEALGPLAGQLRGAQGELSGIDPKKLEELHVEETKLKIATTGLKLEFASAAAGPLKNFTSRLTELTRLARKGEWSKFGTGIGKMGEEIGKAAEKVLPHIADAFAKAGPKMFLAFGRGFAHASLGGQVVLGAALLTKLGLTRALFAGGGAKALGWFSGGFKGKLRIPGFSGGAGGGTSLAGGISGSRGPAGAGSLANPIAVVMEGGGGRPGSPGGGPVPTSKPESKPGGKVLDRLRGPAEGAATFATKAPLLTGAGLAAILDVFAHGAKPGVVQTPGNILKAQGSAAVDLPGKLVESTLGLHVPRLSKALGIVPDKLGFDPYERPDLAVRYMLTGKLAPKNATPKTAAAKQYAGTGARGPGRPEARVPGDNAKGGLGLYEKLPKKIVTRLELEDKDTLHELTHVAVELERVGKGKTVLQVITNAPSAAAAVQALRAVTKGVPPKKVIQILHNAGSSKAAIEKLHKAVGAVPTSHHTSFTSNAGSFAAEIERNIGGMLGHIGGAAARAAEGIAQALRNAVPKPHHQRRGGLVGRYQVGGMVDAMVSPGEAIIHGGSVWTVPGTRTAADSVYTQLPVGAAVLTASGQQMMAQGASLNDAIAYQAPHFAKGGFVSTAYGPPWGGIEGTGTTATGIDLHNSPKVYLVAVDPSVIPLHSKLKISPNPFGYAGNFAAEDTGGAIKGNRIDFYDWKGRADQNAWGRRNVTVSNAGKGGPINSAGGSTKVTQDLILGRSRTRAGLVPDAFSQGVEAGLAGLTPGEVRRANRGARGARVSPIVSAIAGAYGSVTRALKTSAAKGSSGKAGHVILTGGANMSVGREPQIRADLGRLAGKLGKPVYVISGYRTPQHSVAVGGFAKDPHTRGEAADIGVGSASRDSMFNVGESTLRSVGLRRPFYPPDAKEVNHVQLLRRGGLVHFRRGGLSKRARENREREQHNEAFGPSFRDVPPAPRPPQADSHNRAYGSPNHPLGSGTYRGRHHRAPGPYYGGRQYRPQPARLGGLIGFRKGGSTTPSKVNTAIHSLQLAGGNTAKIEVATTALDEAIGKLTVGKLNALVLRFRALARKGGKANIVKSFQSVIDEAEFAIGERIGNIGDKIAQRTSNLERSRGALDRGLRRVGTDPSSSAGLLATIGFDDREKVQRERSVKDAEHAKKIADKSGNKDKIKEATDQLHAAQDELDEAVTKGIEDRRAQLRQAAQEVTDTAQFGVSSAQNSLAGVDIAQRLSRTNETPTGLTQKAAAIEAKLIPMLQASLGALNSQLGVLQATGASEAEIQSVLTSIQSAGNEIGNAMAEAAELIRQAAEMAAEELVEKAGHQAGLAQIGLKHEELEERIAGTFDTGGQQRADYIRNKIIPAAENEIAALQNQRKVAEEQGNIKLAEQIAEAIGNEQNGILEDILQANEDVASNTDPKHKVGGQVSFAYGQENITDSLISVGSGA